MESTGSYHLLLCACCFEAGFSIKIINPLIVKKQNQTNLRRVKNDKKDAGLIRYCVANGSGYEFETDKDAIVLKSLVRQRNSLANTVLKMRKQIEDVAYKEDCFDVKINSVYGDISAIIEAKIKDLEKNLKLFRRDEQRLLESIPGVGPITSASFISEVGNITKFSNAKKLVAFIGLDSRVHESGTSVRGKGYISKRGNKILRTRLFNAASVAVLRPNLFQRYFQKKRSEGKPYRVALVATMNKMTHVIYSVWSNKKPFEEKQK